MWMLFIWEGWYNIQQDTNGIIYENGRKINRYNIQPYNIPNAGATEAWYNIQSNRKINKIKFNRKTIKIILTM